MVRLVNRRMAGVACKAHAATAGLLRADYDPTNAMLTGLPVSTT